MVNSTFALKPKSKVVLAAIVALLLSVVTVAAFSVPSYALEETYSQDNGYEPYIGWQDTKWHQNKDNDYTGGTGGAATGRAGHPSFSLTMPLSKGVTAYNGDLYTGDAVTVVTDNNKTNYDTACTFADPYYYKNVILEPQDATQDITFQFSAVAAGGRMAGLLPDEHGGGIIITSTDDPDSWNASTEEGKFEDSDKVVYRVVDGVSSGCRSPWWGNFTFTIPANTLQPNQTYYLALTKNTKWGHTHLHANIVFEFTTDMNAKATWIGDETKAGYGKEQGTGDLKVGVEIPHPSKLTVDLSMLNQGVYMNKVTEPVSYDENGLVQFRVHADGSGSNHQNVDGWNSCVNTLQVYEENPIINPSASYYIAAGDGITCTSYDENGDTNGKPTYHGVNLAMKNLKPGTTYYLMFKQNFNPGNAQNDMGKSIVIEFNTPANTDTLQTACDSLVDLMNSLGVSEDGKDISNATDYVNANVAEQAQTAIANAEALLNDPMALQADIDAAVAAIQEANDAVNAAIKTAATNFNSLADEIAKVQAEVNALLKDVESGTKEVSEENIVAVNEALAAAQSVIDGDVASQNDVDKAIVDLQAALKIFKNNVTVSAPVKPDTDADADKNIPNDKNQGNSNVMPQTNDNSFAIVSVVVLIAIASAVCAFVAYRRIRA